MMKSSMFAFSSFTEHRARKGKAKVICSLLFLFLFAGSAFGATPDTIQSTVCFQDTQGNCLANGLLTFDLSQPAKVISGGGLAAPIRVAVTLTSLGVIPASTLLWGNDQLTPSGTTYRMRLYNSNGLLVADFGAQSIQGTSPIDLSQLTPTSSSGGTVSYVNPALLSGNNAFTGSNTIGLLNGICIVDGIKNATLAAAVTCAGSSGVIEIPMFAVPALTANVTIPVGVTTWFDGPSGITTTGFTLTINGPLIAPDTQIFFGTGTVTLGAAAVGPCVRSTWFPGADGGAKLNTADASFTGIAGEICVSPNGGTSWTTAPTVPTTQHGVFFNQGGTYSLSTGWTVTNQTQWHITGPPGKLTTIQFTGTSGFTATGAGLANASFGDKITDIIFSGNGSLANPVTLIGITRSVFDFSSRNSTGVAVVCQGCVGDIGRFVTSSNEGTFSTVPTGCLLLDQYTVPTTVKSNDNDFFMICEGVGTAGNGIGVEGKNGANNIIRGTEEGISGIGVQVDVNNFYLTLLDDDLESNSVADVLYNGRQMIFENSFSGSTVGIHCGSTGVGLLILSSILPGNVVSPIDVGCGGISYLETGTGAHGTFITSNSDIAYTRAVEQFEIGETAAPACASTVDWFWADSTAHALKMCRGNTGPFSIIGDTTTDTLTNKYLLNQQTAPPQNFGVALAAQTIIPSANVTANSSFTLALVLVQSTLGVGCGAGTNTVTPTFSWTAPGGTAQTSAGTALSISANGTLDTQQADTVIEAVKSGVAVTYTTASTLASAGCSTIPQYTVYAKAQ